MGKPSVFSRARHFSSLPAVSQGAKSTDVARVPLVGAKAPKKEQSPWFLHSGNRDPEPPLFSLTCPLCIHAGRVFSPTMGTHHPELS